MTNDAAANRHHTHHFRLPLTHKQAGGCHTFAWNACTTGTVNFVTNSICDFRTMRSDARWPVMGPPNEARLLRCSNKIDDVASNDRHTG